VNVCYALEFFISDTVEHIIYRRPPLMTFRRSSKLIAIVGFLICFSSIALLYGNLSNAAEEKDTLLTAKKALEAQVDQLKKEISAKSDDFEGRLKQLESAVNACQKVKVALEERNNGIQSTVSFYKKQVQDQAKSVEDAQSENEKTLSDLKSEQESVVKKLEDEVEELRGAREEASSCKILTGELRDQLKMSKSDVTRLEGNLISCAKDKERLVGDVDHGEGGDSDVNIDPVKDQGVPVADIPEQPDKIPGQKGAIPEALVPAPGAKEAAPFNEVVKNDAVGAMPPNAPNNAHALLADQGPGVLQPPPGAALLAEQIKDVNIVQGNIKEDDLTDEDHEDDHSEPAFRGHQEA